MTKERKELFTRLDLGRIGGSVDLEKLTKEDLIDLLLALDLKLWEADTDCYSERIRGIGRLLLDYWGEEDD